jgi:putative toxin-antitoxin system antitoxin component (TIGR02293 family)
MATAEPTGIKNLDRYWQQVQAKGQSPHAYVSLLGLHTYDTTELHGRVQKGLSYESFEGIRRVLDLPTSRVAELLRIPSRTLSRRREARRLQPEESDRLFRLSRLIGLALQLFEGNLDDTRSWLQAPNSALGNETPLDFATTEVGAREVENLIGRLEHGIPA